MATKRKMEFSLIEIAKFITEYKFITRIMGFSLVEIALLLIPAIIICYWRTLNKKRPMPPMIDLGMLACIRGITSMHSPQWIMDQSRKMKQTIFMLNMPERQPFIIVADPKIARLLIEGDKLKGFHPAEKTHHYKQITAMNGGFNMMASRFTHNDGWAATRKVIAPSFSANNLHKRLPEIYMKSEEFCDILHAHCSSGEPLKDLSEWMTKLTLDVIGVTMFGVDFKALSGDTSEDVETFMRETPNATKEYFLRQLLNPLRKYLFWNTDVARARASVPKFMAFAQRIIDGYRNTSGDDINQASILGHIVRSDGYQSEAERTSDCLGFLLAGMETSAFQLAWVIVEVTKDIRVLRKLQQELDSSLPCDKDKFTPDILSGMKYLQQVIKETMRLQPVVAGGMVRQVPKDIEHEGFTIPKGSTANIHYMTLFRQGIREPDKFIPERWEASDPDAEKLKEIYIPFSSGKRNCIGQNLADLELKLLVATLFRTFTFEFTAEIEYEYFQTYKPKNTDLIIRCRILAKNAPYEISNSLGSG
eukprot:CAMPEP_0119046280 /NCGR_PEP_ID=MMETSP1177-20130426/45582_1 /TAXON_ID=2985 /ORGANISM="Ochromonas sp, Strain CCMP1899" /LENGTH=532 /DNA_ID=CAMNT_0007019207 /DNA_START=180 /DNA_END=1774 /DNA_ORIENTATION=+